MRSKCVSYAKWHSIKSIAMKYERVSFCHFRSSFWSLWNMTKKPHPQGERSGWQWISWKFSKFHFYSNKCWNAWNTHRCRRFDEHDLRAKQINSTAKGEQVLVREAQIWRANTMRNKCNEFYFWVPLFEMSECLVAYAGGHFTHNSGSKWWKIMCVCASSRMNARQMTSDRRCVLFAFATTKRKKK